MVKIKRKLVRGDYEYLLLSGVKKNTLIKKVERKYGGDLKSDHLYNTWYIKRKKRR